MPTRTCSRMRYRGDSAPDLWRFLSSPPTSLGRAPAAQVPPVNQQGRGQSGALVAEQEAEEEVNGVRAGLEIEREEASSLHFCSACVRSRGDVRSQFTPLSKHHHPGARRVPTNGRVREASRANEASGGLDADLNTPTILLTVRGWWS